MRGALPNYYHSYTFFSFFLVLVLFRHVCSINTLSSTETMTIGGAIVSPGDIFELGFFRISLASTEDGDDGWYLGIWYKNIPERTYVWIANRDKPLANKTGTLKISCANLVLLDYSGTPVWSTNVTEAVKFPVMAELLDNGNFVLRDSKSHDQNQILWQSFDYPGDTLLPGMKIGRNRKTGHESFLRSWKSQLDLSSGDLTLKLGTQEVPEFYIDSNGVTGYRTGPWNGVGFSGMQTMQNRSYVDVVNNVIETKDEVAYSFKATDHNLHTRITMSFHGLLEMFTWDSTSTSTSWISVWAFGQEICDFYQNCGPDSYCDMNTSPKCNCIKGFVPYNETAWASGETSSGCVRKSKLSCFGDGYLLMKKMKLPETSTAILDKRIGLKECEDRCSNDCKCTGFANSDIRNGGSGCLIWTGELMDMRSYVAGGQDLYVKIGLNK